MKILHIVSRYPPFSACAVGRQCRMIVDELSKRGHFNRVLTSNETSRTMLDRERAVQRRLHVHVNSKTLSFPRVFSYERNNQRAMREELDEALPDVALIWNMSGLSSLPVWELQDHGIPTVFAVFDSWPRQREQDDPWYHWWMSPLPWRARSLRRAFHSIGVTRLLRSRFPIRAPTDLRLRHAFFSSRALRDSVANAGFDVEGSEIIPYCIGRENFPPAALRRPELRRILWIGKMDADDDPMTAVQTIQELRHHGAMRISLDLFGRGDAVTESRLLRYVRSAQLGGVVNIHHTGGDELAALFPTYDLFLHTARFPGAFPQILLRAMAAQLPIVSTVEGSCADVIRHGENAVAARAGNPVDCASKILELTQKPEWAERIARQGYDEVLNLYSSSLVAGRIDNQLSKLIHQRAGTESYPSND